MAATPPQPGVMPEWFAWANLALTVLENVIGVAEGLVANMGNQPAHVAQLQALKDAHANLAQNTPAPPGA